MAWWNFWYKSKDNDKSNTVEHPYRLYDIATLNAIVDNQSILNRRNRDLLDLNASFDSSVVDLANVDSGSILFGNEINKFSKNIMNWQLSMTPEIKWCIDEILSEIAGVDLQLKQESGYNEIDDRTQVLISQEFIRFKSLLNYNLNNLNEDFKHLMIEGELAYELVKSEEHPENGLIGIRRIYSDDFEVVYSPILTNGFALNIDLDKIFNKYGISGNTGTATSKFLYNKNTGEFETDKHHVGLSFPNVVYICYDKLPGSNQALSLLDYAHKPYFELNTIQQAAIVMRTVRSPERLLFNIDVGGLDPKVAQQHIQRFSQSLRARKFAVPGKGGDGQGSNELGVGIGQAYNPATMLESYVFGKSAQSQGATVSTIGSTANFDQIADVNYFHNRLLQVFKIPFARITDPSQKQYQPSQQLTYDEVRFYRFIESIEERFDNVITQMFLEDLRLRDIGKGRLTNEHLSLKFDVPARYALFLEIEAEKAKLDLYDAYAQHEEFNKGLLAKKYLNMSDTDLQAHREANVKDAKLAKEQEENGSDGMNSDNSPFDRMPDNDTSFGGGNDMEAEEPNEPEPWPE